MAKRGKVEVRTEHCKGCGLCIRSCKVGSLSLSAKTETNASGYRYLKMVSDACTGCAMCAIMCPDQAIDVYRD